MSDAPDLFATDFFLVPGYDSGNAISDGGNVAAAIPAVGKAKTSVPSLHLRGAYATL